MKSFWRQLIINAIIRALSGVFIWLAAKGYITNSQSEVAALVVATILFNVGQTAVNWLLARWHIDLARLTEGVDRQTLAEGAAGVPTITKLIEAATPGPNPSAIETARTLDATPKM